MRALVFDTHGSADVLRVTDLPDPIPGPGQVRVRVVAAGVQPFDTQARAGSMAVPVAFPQQLGNEFAGVVDRVGPGVERWQAGEEVIGWAPMASHADYVVADADAVVAKSPRLGWPEAGALGASGQTALTALRELDVRGGETLLVHAAAGGAGSMAVQLARQRGARVIGTASPGNHDYLRGLGAEPVRYGEGLADRVRAMAPAGVDAALDAIGGRALTDSIELVGDRRRIATLVDHDRAADLGVHGIRARRTRQQLTDLAQLAATGNLTVSIRARYPIHRAREAHRDIEQGHGAGKVVLTFGSECGEPASAEGLEERRLVGPDVV